MFNIGRSNFFIKNMNARDYCMQSTNNYVKKLIEKNKIDEPISYQKLSQQKIINDNLRSINEIDTISNVKIINICIFLSISTFLYFYSNRNKI
jgi:hypothetical protein